MDASVELVKHVLPSVVYIHAEVSSAHPSTHILGEETAMALLAVIIPLLMLGMVLALGRYEELLLPVKKADPSDDAPVGPLGATVPLPVLRSPRRPPRMVASGTNPARPSRRQRLRHPSPR